MNGSRLLYLIEGDVPLLTFLLVWAGILALNGNIQKHKKVALAHAIATLASYLSIIILVRVGYEVGGNAPKWIMTVHHAIIYAIPPALACLMVTGLKGKRSIHKGFALLYVIIWSGALLTGLIILMKVKSWI
ncbi:hypothetical protein MNBD_NITROSPINAE04-1594 [hydrothermal vent metagenome]|uniref:Uncharacterized protein n=1 Tax=hydrothermal vent metagenome TaxID=652676 RepID=A0A3B1C4C6_9ZZZZ